MLISLGEKKEGAVARKTYKQAINEALAQEMERDPTVVTIG